MSGEGSRPKAHVVIVAAGTSSRMGGIDKMNALIGGRPLLGWTLDAVAASPAIERIVVVTAPSRAAEVREAAWLPARATVVGGGARRQESVAAGVAQLEQHGAAADSVVLVHDGARPVLGHDLVEAVIDATATHGAAIPIVPIVQTLKRVRGGTVVDTVDRDDFGVAQTPQGVRLEILQAAYARFSPGGPRTFTDEAALLEACTIPVHVVPGQPDNIKVTHPADLGRAAALLRADPPRVGLGEDWHSFGPGGPLALGGTEIPGAPRLAGHSDGDVVLHAVADALLGAAGLGDLGRLFPADDRTPRGIASSDLLSSVVASVLDAGYQATHVDVTIVAARPRLGERLDTIRDRLAELLAMRADQVSVKASTGNLDGSEGAGRGISARAVAIVERVS